MGGGAETDGRTDGRKDGQRQRGRRVRVGADGQTDGRMDVMEGDGGLGWDRRTDIQTG